MKFFNSHNVKCENNKNKEPLWLKSYFPPAHFINIVQRLLFTILMLSFIILVQTMVPIPGVDQNSLKPLLYSLSNNTDYDKYRHILSAHVFLLGLSPFVVSNILVSVGADLSEKHQSIKMIIRKVPFMGFAVDEFIMGKEEGKAGEGRLKRSVRWLGIPCMFLEALSYTSYLSRHTIPGSRLDWPLSCIAIRFEIYSILTLIAGACIVEKVANDIDENGLGNGSLNVICLEILIHFFHDSVYLIEFFCSDVFEHFGLMLLAMTTFLTTFWLASWLNTVSDRIPLEPYKYSKSVTKKGLQTNRYLPLKWLPQGVLPIVFSNILLARIQDILRNITNADVFTNFFSSDLLSAIFFGVIVSVLHKFLYMGVNSKNMWKVISILRVKIPGIRPDSKILEEINKRIHLASCKGGIAAGLTATLTKILEKSLSNEIKIRFPLTNMLLLSNLLDRTSRQLISLSQKPRLKPRF